MSELSKSDQTVYIGQGEMDDSEWQQFMDRAVSIGGSLVAQSVETGEASAEERYLGRQEFVCFAAERGVKLPQAIRAYNGLANIYYKQQDDSARIADFPKLVFDQEPKMYEYARGKFAASNFSVEIESLIAFVNSLDIVLDQTRSKLAVARFYQEVLPPQVGVKAVDLFRAFVLDHLDKSTE